MNSQRRYRCFLSDCHAFCLEERRGRLFLFQKVHLFTEKKLFSKTYICPAMGSFHRLEVHSRQKGKRRIISGQANSFLDHQSLLFDQEYTFGGKYERDHLKITLTKELSGTCIVGENHCLFSPAFSYAVFLEGSRLEELVCFFRFRMRKDDDITEIQTFGFQTQDRDYIKLLLFSLEGVLLRELQAIWRKDKQASDQQSVLFRQSPYISEKSKNALFLPSIIEGTLWIKENQKITVTHALGAVNRNWMRDQSGS